MRDSWDAQVQSEGSSELSPSTSDMQWVESAPLWLYGEITEVLPLGELLLCPGFLPPTKPPDEGYWGESSYATIFFRERPLFKLITR